MALWFLEKPSDEQIQAFLASRSQQTFSYAEVGMSQDGSPAGYDLDHNRVQIGITTTQLGAGPVIECMAAWLMAGGGILTAWILLQLALHSSRPHLVRGLWTMAAVSLMGSMVLAGLYGSRFFTPMEWLDIPWMRALHGTANAFGFGLAALLGWWLSPAALPASDRTEAS